MIWAHPLANWHANKGRIQTIQMENQGANVTVNHWRLAATPKNSKDEFDDVTM
jgi:hypothetical protein